MSQLEDMHSPGSDDPDAMVAQLLNQTESSTPGLAAAANDPGSLQQVEQVQQPREPELTKFPDIEIRVPVVDNPGDYEYLPGHFKVRRVLRIDSSNPERPLYTVHLASGERSTVRATPFY
jgi:hypothetical protein